MRFKNAANRNRIKGDCLSCERSQLVKSLQLIESSASPGSSFAESIRVSAPTTCCCYIG